MRHKPWKRLLLCLGKTLALASVASCTLAANSSPPQNLQPHAAPILHSFLNSTDVYPESVVGWFFLCGLREGRHHRQR